MSRSDGNATHVLCEFLHAIKSRIVTVRWCITQYVITTERLDHSFETK